MANIQKRERGWKGLNGSQHPRSKAVVSTNIKTGESTKHGSINQCAKALGLYQSNIQLCLNGTNKSSGGYTFNYLLEGEELSKWQRALVNKYKGIN